MADSLKNFRLGLGPTTGAMRHAGPERLWGYPRLLSAEGQHCPGVKIYGTSYIHASKDSVKRQIPKTTRGYYACVAILPQAQPRRAQIFFERGAVGVLSSNFLRLGQNPNPGIFTRHVQRGPAWQHYHACTRVMGARWPGAAHHPQKKPMARVRQTPRLHPQCRWHHPQYRPRAMAPQWSTAYRQKPEQALRCWALPGLRQVRSAGPKQGPT